MAEVKTRKKLIEVALPLDAINEEGSRRKRKAPAGYPTTLHKWWAQRPLAAARAVIFAQMVDDPSANPDLFTTKKAQEKERQRLFRIIQELVQWENTTNERVLQAARDEIWQSWRRACAHNADHPQARELFDRNKLPAFFDPFAGGASLPLEAQRLGLEAYASDLNPVAVLINKAMIEIPPKFAGQPPVNPEWRSKPAKERELRTWRGAQGLAEDVRYYGLWMRDEAEKRIGHLYPKIEVTAEMASERPDLEQYVGQKLTVIAWLWARTVKSPNPAFAEVGVPLASTFVLSTKKGKEAYVDAVIEDRNFRFTVKVGKPGGFEVAKAGTKLSRGANFRCLMSGSPIDGNYIKAEGKAGRMGTRLMAIVAEGKHGRLYLAPTEQHETTAQGAKPEWQPETSLPDDPRNFWTVEYGLRTYGDLFTPRQLVALTTFSDLIGEVRERIRRDAVTAGLADDQAPLRDGGTGSESYSESLCTYLSIALSRLADYGSSVATWRPKDGAMRSTMPKQAIQMAWDFAEGSPFGGSSSGFRECVQVIAKVMEAALSGEQSGRATQANVCMDSAARIESVVVSTDPPYYDNISYADLSDFFYLWLRRTLRSTFPDTFATLTVPKMDELIATPYRHGNKENAERFFLKGMTRAMKALAAQTHPAFPVTIYYAYKQSEAENGEGAASTGWDTFLAAVILAGFAISGTWPMRTEGDNRQTGIGNNALASSIILVCRPRAADAQIATRREFVTALKAELPQALAHLQRRNIAPVDLAQAAIGPGMAVFTRCAQVLDAEGKPLSVREALSLINRTLDEALAEQEGDFDADSRWAIAWFEHVGFAEGEYGVAETLSKAKVTSIEGLKRAGILDRHTKGGKVRLLRPSELPDDWDPMTDPRLTAWEVVHHLIRVLEADGETAAAELVQKLGAKAELARELAYRLYNLCERKKRTAEALSYNGLVQSWSEIVRLAREQAPAPAAQAGLFGEE